ncbi:MAG: carbohydrate-binding domain-containing protein, partial [Ruminococcus sp.]|nr:carbohydrate-binding domain-containing protein [Ruminococcus sp.]
MQKIISLLLVLILMLSLLSGCAKETESESKTETQIDTATADSVTPTDVEFENPNSDMFTERDFRTEYDENKAVSIKLNGTSASSSSDSVKISGSTVTITEEATYVVTGELNDGMLIVDAPETAKLQLVLDGVNIKSETSAALYILEADKVFLTLAKGSKNTLENGGSFTAIDDNNIDSALFSK